MDDALRSLFSRFDRGTITRRQLLQALGIAVVAAPISSAISQGRYGAGRAGSVVCDTTPWKYPFEPTGWKTVALDHFTMQAVDFKKEAAYYMALMSWIIRDEDDSQAILAIGDDVGTVVIRGGYVPPAAPPAPPAPVLDSAAAAAAAAGPGGGRGGGRGNRPPRTAVWDSFVWTIDKWDAKKVQAELRKRGLDPIAVTDGRGYESFHVKDPDGFELGISNRPMAKPPRAGSGALM